MGGLLDSLGDGGGVAGWDNEEVERPPVCPLWLPARAGPIPGC
jgi:hypothetical protein